jgi:hypothetical protein
MAGLASLAWLLLVTPAVSIVGAQQHVCAFSGSPVIYMVIWCFLDGSGLFWPAASTLVMMGRWDVSFQSCILRATGAMV